MPYPVAAQQLHKEKSKTERQKQNANPRQAEACPTVPVSGFHESQITPHTSQVTSRQLRQHCFRVGLILALLAPRTFLERFPAPGVVQSAASLNGARNVPRHRRRQLHELAARPLQREAMLVISARRIRSQRGNASSIGYLHRFRAPGL